MPLPRIIARVRSTVEFGAIQVNPATNRVYITRSDPESGAVTVLDATANRILTHIRVGRLPSNLAIQPRTNRIYVTNFRDGSVSVIHGRTNRVIRTVRVGQFPGSIAVNARTNLVYVTSASGTLVVLDGRTNRIRKTTRLGGRPSEIAVDEQLNRIYVTNTAKNIVTVVHGTTQAILSTIRVGQNPVIPPALNRITHRLYVANNLSRFLSVIDGRSGKLVKNIQLGRLQSDVTLNPMTNRIYAASAQIEGPGKLFVVNGGTNKIVSTMKLPTSSQLFLNPNTNHLFISSFEANTLSVYEADTLKRITSFPSAAGNIALNSLSNRLYVAGSGSIIVIQDVR